jgi:uncharacterized protein YaeQ
MALTSTMHVFDLDLSDIDRGVYMSQRLEVARHPSETEAYMLTRVLAFALEYEEGLAFGPGLCAADEPALTVKDLTGQLKAIIEVGSTDADRLHRNCKAVNRVVVYCHHDIDAFLRNLAGRKIYAPERLRIIAVDRELLGELEAGLQRRNKLSISVTEGTLYVDYNGQSLTGAMTDVAWR